VAEPECTVEMYTPSAADEARARAACEAARARFVSLFGPDVPRVVVLVQERTGYRIGILDGKAVVLWPGSDALEARVRDGPAGRAWIASQWSDVLPHEIGHALTAALFFPDGQFRPTGYGTPLPDWFEEGVAVWTEPEASRERRLEAGRSLPPGRLDLRTILTMRHPAAGDTAALAFRDGSSIPADPALWDFYPQSAAVLGFILDRGGPAAVRELARRLDEDPDDPYAIVALPGLPASFRAVDAAWREWLATGHAGP
jgi:hypothetical protein